jgi:hypothetical protein
MKRSRGREREVAALIALVAFGACDSNARTNGEPVTPSEEAPSPAAETQANPEPAVPETHAGTIYVPAYSRIRSADTRETRLGVTLSVHNVDPNNSVTLRFVDYFDTGGRRVRRYLERPRPLRPHETTDFFVEVMDETGGVGANFVIGWTAPSTPTRCSSRPS